MDSNHHTQGHFFDPTLENPSKSQSYDAERHGVDLDSSIRATNPGPEGAPFHVTSLELPVPGSVIRDFSLGSLDSQINEDLQPTPAEFSNGSILPTLEPPGILDNNLEAWSVAAENGDTMEWEPQKAFIRTLSETRACLMCHMRRIMVNKLSS